MVLTVVIHSPARIVNVEDTRHVVLATGASVVVVEHLLLFSANFVFDGDGKTFTNDNAWNAVNYYNLTSPGAWDEVTGSG